MHRISILIHASATVAVLANLAHAHPGHATEIVSPTSGWHYFVQPEHAGVMLIALLACGVAAYAANRRRNSRMTPALVRRHS